MDRLRLKLFDEKPMEKEGRHAYGVICLMQKRCRMRGSCAKITFSRFLDTRDSRTPTTHRSVNIGEVRLKHETHSGKAQFLHARR